ncbi:SH3 domain-binding glutamic acid-rich protein-like isoform X1 [Cricetulus griseus]|uniref:SH3 domain-binding glutamic acid-rich protein-like isoform X1 n=1 Tax=Cricetulus griseus TaxID=10029 RepID=UPI0015C3E74A|nr:SH3 domain-binding glutamic acid-rich protein-like isoform X1 [Cricetulus griseus]
MAGLSICVAERFLDSLPRSSWTIPWSAAASAAFSFCVCLSSVSQCSQRMVVGVFVALSLGFVVKKQQDMVRFLEANKIEFEEVDITMSEEQSQ